MKNRELLAAIICFIKNNKFGKKEALLALQEKIKGTTLENSISGSDFFEFAQLIFNLLAFSSKTPNLEYTKFLKKDKNSISAISISK